MNYRFLKGQRLVAAFVIGALLFSYPILSLFNRPQLIFGVPTLYVYLFVTWAVLIALYAFIVERK